MSVSVCVCVYERELVCVHTPSHATPLFSHKTDRQQQTPTSHVFLFFEWSGLGLRLTLLGIPHLGGRAVPLLLAPVDPRLAQLGEALARV
jgi:hypothetical protein